MQWYHWMVAGILFIICFAAGIYIYFGSYAIEKRKRFQTFKAQWDNALTRGVVSESDHKEQIEKYEKPILHLSFFERLLLKIDKNLLKRAADKERLTLIRSLVTQVREDADRGKFRGTI